MQTVVDTVYLLCGFFKQLPLLNLAYSFLLLHLSSNSWKSLKIKIYVGNSVELNSGKPPETKRGDTKQFGPLTGRRIAESWIGMSE